MLISLADRERLCQTIEKNLHCMPEEEKKIFQLILSLLYDLRDCAKFSGEGTEDIEKLLGDLELHHAELSDRAFHAPGAEDVARLIMLGEKVPELVQEIRRLHGVANALILQAPESDVRN